MELKGVSLKELLMARLRKLILDATSIKFMTMIFIAIVICMKIVSDYVGIAAMLALLGIREYADILGKNNSKPKGD